MWSYSDPLGQLWEAIAEEFSEIDVGVRALREVYEFAVDNPGKFYCKTRFPVTENCYGAWDYEEDGWQSLNFIPSVLKSRLTDLGYRYEETIQNWREKGWLTLDSNGYNLRYSLGTSRTRLVSIRRAAIMEVNDDGYRLSVMKLRSMTRYMARIHGCADRCSAMSTGQKLDRDKRRSQPF